MPMRNHNQNTGEDCKPETQEALAFRIWGSVWLRTQRKLYLNQIPVCRVMLLCKFLYEEYQFIQGLSSLIFSASSSLL